MSSDSFLKLDCATTRNNIDALSLSVSDDDVDDIKRSASSATRFVLNISCLVRVRESGHVFLFKFLKNKYRDTFSESNFLPYLTSTYWLIVFLRGV